MPVRIVPVVDLTNLQGAIKRATAPLAEPRMRDAAFDVMRFGPGSVDAQFEAQATMDGGSVSPWPATRDFGTARKPRRTMQRSGALREDWLGIGDASIQRATDTSATIGVDTNRREYAAIFQRATPVQWRADPSNRAANGRLAAQVFLGIEFDVWVSEAKLLQGWPIQPRRISVSDPMRDRFGELVGRYIATGEVRP